MFRATLKILKEAFASASTPPSREKRLYDALNSIEALRQPLKKIAPVTEAADLRLACANGEVTSWSFDQYVDIKLTHKGWFANAVTDMFHKFRDAAKKGRLGFEQFAASVKDDKSAQFIFDRTGDIETLAKDLAAMTPEKMKDVPVTKFWA